MESLGLNKLTCFNAGSLTEKKKVKNRWKKFKDYCIRYVIFLMQIVSDKNKSILINTIKKLKILSE